MNTFNSFMVQLQGTSSPFRPGKSFLSIPSWYNYKHDFFDGLASKQVTFNSFMVQLQAAVMSILSLCSLLSIPSWYNYKPPSCPVPSILSFFQFLHGTITSTPVGFDLSVTYPFQFLHGTITSKCCYWL